MWMSSIYVDPYIDYRYMQYTLNNIASLEGTLQYDNHATPGGPLQGSPGVAWWL